jgi:chromate transporter
MATVQHEAQTKGRVGLPALFAGFLQLGLISFGGGTLAWLHREIVERRRWIDDAQFLSQAGLAQLMPGSNGVNLVVLSGQWLRRGPGAVIAVLGLLLGPLVVVLGLLFCYRRIAGIAGVHAVLDGVAAAAIGMILATGLKLVQRSAADWGAVAATAATVVCVGVLRWPMLPVVLALAPLSIARARLRRNG